jgi:alpha-1,2-mannosyltransferase
MSTSSFRLPTVSGYQAAFLAALLLVFTAVSVQYSLKAVQHRSAFVRWQNQVLAMDAGEDIAKKFNYPNPPVMAVVLLPFASLPPLVGALAWFYAKVGMTLLSLFWVFRLIEKPGRPFPAVGQAMAVVLSLRPILGDLEHGNVNLFILFLIIAALTAFRTKRDLLGGAALGLAISCKVTPALFVPYLIWKRAWRALAGVVVGLGLFFWPGVVPGLRLGFAENQQQLVSWYDEMVHPFLIEGKVTSEHPNQSLPGLVYRLLTVSPSFSTYVDNVYTPTEYDNFLSLEPGQAKWVVKGCMGLFALLILGVCRTSFERRSGWRLAAEYSLVVLGMLLFSERTWKHHCVTLLLPIAVICYVLTACQPGRLVTRMSAVVLAATALLMATTSTVFDKDFAKQAQVYGAYTAAHLLLVGALAALLRKREESAPADDGGHPTRIAQPLYSFASVPRAQSRASAGDI